MALAPTAFKSQQYEDFGGFFLKFFLQGTTTPLVMATDSTGGTTLAKAEISSGGTVPIGFIKTAGDAIFIPYVDKAYDAWLFPTAAEADANDTTNATRIADNVAFLVDFANQVGIAKTFDTVALMVADTDLAIGNIVNTAGHTSKGDGGDNQYEVTAAIGVNNGGSVIDLANGLQAKALYPVQSFRSQQWGVGTDQVNILTFIAPSIHQNIRDGNMTLAQKTQLTSEVQAALDYYEGRSTATVRQGTILFFPAGIYDFTAGLFIGGYCGIRGENLVATAFGFIDAPSSVNCITLLDNSPNQPFSGLHTFGTTVSDIEIFCKDDANTAITTPGVHQGCFIHHIKIRNVNNTGVNIGGAGGSAHFDMYDVEIVGGTGTPVGDRRAIMSNMGSTVILTKISVNGGGASDLFNQALFIANGGHLVNNIAGEFCEDVIFFHSGSTADHTQNINNITANSTVTRSTLHIDAGYQGAINANGITGPFLNGVSAARSILNDDEPSTTTARDITVPHWQWAHPGTKGADLNTVDRLVFTDSSPSATEVSDSLDAYSAGTFTVSVVSGLTGATFSVNQGNYVRIGKQVICNIELKSSAGSAAAARISFSGLPYAAQGIPEANGGGFITFTDSFNAVNPTVAVGAGGSTFDLFKVNGADFQGGDIGTPALFELHLTLMYQTDA